MAEENRPPSQEVGLQSPPRDFIREKLRADLIAELDKAGVLDCCEFREGVSREAVGRAISDTIITYRWTRKGSKTFPRYPRTLGSALNLLKRSVNPERRGNSSNPYRIDDALLKRLVEDYTLRVAFDNRILQYLKNGLVSTLAGILRAVLEQRGRAKEFLPDILMAAKVLPSVGDDWNPDTVHQRIHRIGGTQVADLCALVPLSKEEVLRPFRRPFTMFATKSSIWLVFLSESLDPMPPFPRDWQSIPPEQADRSLLLERWPTMSRATAKLKIPALTCHRVRP